MRSGDKAKKQSDSVPTCATPISITDSQHKDSDAFALYKILVHMFHLEHKPAHLSFILMMALWSKYCDVRMHVQSQRKRPKKEGISEKASGQVASLCLHWCPHFAWDSWCSKPQKSLEYCQGTGHLSTP